MKTDIDGSVALITGAASGIGRATALAFAARGAQVAVSDTDESGGKETVNQIEAAGGTAMFARADVAQPQEVIGLVQRTVERFGRLDCAFNNAGIEGEMADTVSCSETNWDRVIAVNLTGVWNCMKHELAVMYVQGSGSIVNCASVAGLVGFRNLPAYCASKGGVIELTRAAALESAETGIRVNAICPGVIETPMVERVTGHDPQIEAQFKALEPVGRMGAPEEIADAVAWLCSESASFVTGHPLVVDGGLTVQ